MPKLVASTLDAFSILKTIKAEGAQPVTKAMNSQAFLVTMFDGLIRVTFTYDANRRSRESGRRPHNHGQ